jgi:FlaA1/EpsC-like NDP-sugar epimerase
MTRFIMTLEEAVRLVMESTFLAQGGEVFVTKMPAIAISDLAAVMIQELAPLHGFRPEDIELVTIGSKAGEKLYEELINEEEVRRTVELPYYFVVLPAFKAVYETIDYTYPSMTSQQVKQPYNSSGVELLTRPALRAYLRQHGLLQ